MKAVVFDMDGVLFDTEQICLRSWKKVAPDFGIEDMGTFFMRCVGRSMADTKLLMLEQYGEDFPYDSFRQAAHDSFWQYVEDNGTPMKPGVKELLEYLKQEGYRIGLASSTRRVSVLKHLEETGILEYFQAIITGDMVTHSKPNPEIFQLACRALETEPAEAYAIEDSPNGIRAAYGAGMKPLMVPDMIAPDEEMEKLSFGIFKDLTEVKEFLKQAE